MEEITIVEYQKKYDEDIKDLLVELEEYIISIDKDNLDRIDSNYRELMFFNDLNEVNNNNGKIYLAVKEDKAVGVIFGILKKYDEYDYLDYKCPKKGVITELIVTKKIRTNGIGQRLINKIEEYFTSIECEYVSLEAFAYNDLAINFYNKNNYHTRMLHMIKKIGGHK